MCLIVYSLGICSVQDSLLDDKSDTDCQIVSDICQEWLYALMDGISSTVSSNSFISYAHELNITTAPRIYSLAQIFPH